MAKPTQPSRTFKVTDPHMKGKDIGGWKEEVKALFNEMGIQCPIKTGDNWGVDDRSYMASLVKAYGMLPEVMKDGVTPELRTRIRNGKLSPTEIERKKGVVDYRRALRQRWNQKAGKVALPVAHILEHSWGYHPGVHDGLDIITDADPVIFAVVKSKVIDIHQGWWGLGAPSNAALKAKGDGIIQLEVLETVGPFTKGLHLCYGHAEKASVKVGDIVEAGDPIGHAGLANAWHIHWMINRGEFGTQGRGSVDPEPFLEYCIKNA